MTRRTFLGVLTGAISSLVTAIAVAHPKSPVTPTQKALPKADVRGPSQAVEEFEREATGIRDWQRRYRDHRAAFYANPPAFEVTHEPKGIVYRAVLSDGKTYGIGYPHGYPAEKASCKAMISAHQAQAQIDGLIDYRGYALLPIR